MKVLIACEESQSSTIAFRKKGHQAFSCDIKPCSGGHKEWHLQCDVRDILSMHWDMIIAHPVCKYITNSGVRWLDRDIDRWKKMYEACEFFKIFLNHSCEKIAIENPIPHKYSLGWIGKKYTQIIHPWQHGHTEKKATCLWLKGLPEIKETNNVKHVMDSLPKSVTDRIHRMPPGPERETLRSKAYDGISKAMAEQWG